MYALPAWGPLLNVKLVHILDGFLKRSFSYGFTNKLITIQPLLDSATEDLFCKMKSSNHCLHRLLPPDRTVNQVLRTRGHSFQLPTCSFNLHKKSFVISCLFKFLTRVCSCFLCVLFFMFNFFSNVLSHLTFAVNFCAYYYYLLLTTVMFTNLFLHACLLLLSINCIVLSIVNKLSDLH